jgi:hypothetical protein
MPKSAVETDRILANAVDPDEIEEIEELEEL